MSFITRPIVKADEPVLWEMLYRAAHMDQDPGASVQTAQTHPFLAKYVKNWGRQGDVGFIAIEAESHQPTGAAWLRLLIGEEKGCSDIDDDTPELAIAVLPASIGKGVGSQLLTHLLATAKDIYPSAYLSVRATNPAKRLYERLGFIVISEMTNRVGGKSFNMKRDFRPWS